MTNKIFLITGLLLLSISCQNKSTQEQAHSEKAAKGGRYYGGVFRLNETEYIKNLFPHAINDVYSYRIANQIYEGLFDFDQQTLELNTELAESYTVSNEGHVYTIKLKKGILFHDDPCFANGRGREVKASDIAYCFTLLCTQSINNQNFAVFKNLLKGAEKFYAASAGGRTPSFGIEGIKIIDDYTLQLELLRPNSLFLLHLARPACYIFPKEAYDKYGIDMRIHAVGTGPFTLSDVNEDISIFLKRNLKYHKKDEHGNTLPFLEGINIQFIKDKKTELFEFKKGNLDMVYRLPAEFIVDILQDSYTTRSGEYSQYDLQRIPEMVSQYLSINTHDPIFKNVNVRKAFNFAIDRDKILTYALNGEGYKTGDYGITPPVFEGYNITDIRGYKLDIDSARYYMNLAGYPDGSGFPTVSLALNSEGARNTAVATEIQKQLKDHLNVTLELKIMPFAQLLEKYASGDFQIVKTAWYADYPNAENFLYQFHSHHLKQKNPLPNITRYNNHLFDAYYDKGLRSATIAEANENFKQAEQILMADVPVIVLWYDEGYRLLHSYVKNFPNNSMQYRDLSEVFFQKARVVE